MRREQALHLADDFIDRHFHVNADDDAVGAVADLIQGRRRPPVFLPALLLSFVAFALWFVDHNHEAMKQRDEHHRELVRAVELHCPR